QALPGGKDYVLNWSANDDAGGSGVKHVTIYVATNGGDFEIWDAQDPDAVGTKVFTGDPSNTYEFLALATDVAGNQERPPPGTNPADDGSQPNLGQLPTVAATTPPDLGIPPAPTTGPSGNTLFARAEEGIPAALPAQNGPDFTQVIRPFTGQAFAT